MLEASGKKSMPWQRKRKYQQRIRTYKEESNGNIRNEKYNDKSKNSMNGWKAIEGTKEEIS